MTSLAEVLGLLHDAPDAVRRLRAVVTSQQDDEVAMRVWREQSEAGGASLIIFGDDDDEDESGPDESTRIWLDFERDLAREESAERLVVRRGGIWWSWDPHTGSLSNQDDPDTSTSVADDQRWIVGGLPILAPLRLALIGSGEVAGRATIRCRGEIRRTAAGGLDDWSLHFLPGYGARAYELDVDAQLGLILRVAAFADGSEFARREVAELGIDEDFDDELFRFVAPDGSPVRGFRDLHGAHHHDLRPDRLLELATFPVLVPARVPDGWEASLHYAEGSERPPTPPSANVFLRSPDNLRSLQITQSPAERADDHDEWDHDRPNPWQEAERGGLRLQWREPREDWQPARVRFEHAGVRVLIDSQQLPAADLLDLAENLVELRAQRPDFGI